MKLVKKLSFSLIEVTIAAALAAMLIGLLLTSFTYSSKVKHTVHLKQEKILKHKFMQEKLTQIFSSVDSKNAGFTFKNNVLKFTYHHGQDPDIYFSCDVEASLELVGDRLVLVNEVKDHVRRECLLNDVQSVDWEFLPKPKPTEFGKSLVKKTWEDESLPLALRLNVYFHSDDPISFAFFPGSSLETIEAAR